MQIKVPVTIDGVDFIKHVVSEILEAWELKDDVPEEYKNGFRDFGNALLGLLETKLKHEDDDIEDPLWCEDCGHFGKADMGGEGECDVDNHSTWYGCPVCRKYKPKEV